MEVLSRRSEQAFSIRRLILATVVLAIAVVGSAGHADENQNSEAPSFEIKTFQIQDVDNLPPVVDVTETTVSLIGEPGSKDFGLAYRGKLTPTVDMSGDEKLAVYLYTRCDGQTPSQTKAVNVGTVEIGTIKKGKGEFTMIATKDAKAFVPLENVQCAKIRIEDYVPKGGPEPSTYLVKTISILNGADLDTIKMKEADVSLIGDPDSKSFGLAYRGKLTPTASMNGTEKLAMYLYTRCDNHTPSQTKAVQVGAVDIGAIKQTRREYTMVAAKDVTTFVPLKDVQCARVDIE